jgi:vesicle-associated membrane protein 7
MMKRVGFLSFSLDFQSQLKRHKMKGLIYAVVARNQTILCEYAVAVGNFRALAELILQRIPPTPGKMTYVYDTFLFHYITKSDGFTFLCLSRQDFSRRRAFQFLDELGVSFAERFDSEPNRTDYSEFSSRISEHLQNYVEPDKATALKDEIEHVRQIMMANIGNIMFMVEKVLERGDHIDNLVDRTNDLSTASNAFRQQAVQVRNSMWFKNARFIGIVVVLILVTMYMLTGYTCGFPAFSNCTI